MNPAQGRRKGWESLIEIKHILFEKKKIDCARYQTKVPEINFVAKKIQQVILQGIHTLRITLCKQQHSNIYGSEILPQKELRRDTTLEVCRFHACQFSLFQLGLFLNVLALMRKYVCGLYNLKAPLFFLFKMFSFITVLYHYIHFSNHLETPNFLARRLQQIQAFFSIFTLNMASGKQ